MVVVMVREMVSSVRHPFTYTHTHAHARTHTHARARAHTHSHMLGDIALDCLLLAPPSSYSATCLLTCWLGWPLAS